MDGLRLGIEHRLGKPFGVAEDLPHHRLQLVDHLVGEALTALDLDRYCRRLGEAGHKDGSG
jgi:hypothetical protein